MGLVLKEEEFLPPIEDMHKSGIYKIQLNNIIYIGKSVDFYNRFKKHKSCSHNFKIKELIKNGGKFDIIEIIDKDIDKFKWKLASLEERYIRLYSYNKNYTMLNKEHPNVSYNPYLKDGEYLNALADYKSKIRLPFGDIVNLENSGFYMFSRENTYNEIINTLKSNKNLYVPDKDKEEFDKILERSKKEMELKETFALLIAGSRTYNDYDEFCKVTDLMLSKIKKSYNIEIIQGGANGADKFAEIYANNHGYTCTLFKADWDNYGKSAGYRRNSEMHNYIKQFEHRGCLCFWDGFSKGTQHNFKLANDNNTPLRIYNYTNKEYIKETN